MPPKNQGFTLIELLVVIILITVILAAALVMFSGATAKGRDAKREEDMKSLHSALGLYINQLTFYPICPQEELVDGKTDCLSAALLEAKATSGVPRDPKHQTNEACGGQGAFVYCYQSQNNGASYTLRYHLETDTVQGKSAGWQTQSP